MITEKDRPDKVWINKGTAFAGDVKELCKVEEMQTYSTMSEIKAAFAERKILSLKNIPERQMEDCGYKHIHGVTQFATTLILDDIVR